MVDSVNTDREGGYGVLIHSRLVEDCVISNLDLGSKYESHIGGDWWGFGFRGSQAVLLEENCEHPGSTVDHTNVSGCTKSPKGLTSGVFPFVGKVKGSWVFSSRVGGSFLPRDLPADGSSDGFFQGWKLVTGWEMKKGLLFLKATLRLHHRLPRREDLMPF